MDKYSIYPKQFNTGNYKIQSDTCFVIMPFSDDLNNTYTMIDMAANALNIKCTRADKISTTSEPIITKICTQISRSYFIIVDITNLNPNVFYELGIAHVLREASKVLIIKEAQTICPSDIRHLHYYEYSKDNLQELKNTIENFFKENNILSDLTSILGFRELLPLDGSVANKFILDLSQNLQDDKELLVRLLNNKSDKVLENAVTNLLITLLVALNKKHTTEDLYEYYAKLVAYIIQKTYKTVNITECTAKLFDQEYKNISQEWLAEYSISILDDFSYFDNAMSWITGYLKESNPASFDLARYKLEIGLIQTKSSYVDAELTKNLNSKNKTLAEHCANLVKERKTYIAIPVMLKLIEQETSPYLFRSCTEALISMATLEELQQVREIYLARASFIETNQFLYKHLENLEKRITSLQKLSDF